MGDVNFEECKEVASLITPVLFLLIMIISDEGGR